MRKRTLTIPMIGALNTRLDPKLAVVPTITRADNLYRTRTGEWTKRGGFVALPQVYFQTSNVIDQVRKLAARENELVVVDTRRFWSFSPGLQAFVDLSGFQGGHDQTIVTHEVFRFDESSTTAGTNRQPDSQESDVAFGLGCVCNAWTQPTGTSGNPAVFFAVNELATGQKRKGATNAFSSAFVRDPRVVFAGGWFLIFFVEESGAASTLRVFGFDPVSGSTRSAVSVAADLLGTGTGTPFYDVYVRPDNGRVVIAYRSTVGPNLRAMEWDGATNAATIASVIAAAVDPTAIGWIDTGISGTTSPRLVTMTAGGVIRRILNGATLVQSSSVVLDAVPGDVSAVTGVYNGTDDTIFYQIENADPELTRVKYGNSSGPGVDTFMLVGALASKAFEMQPTGGALRRPYVLVRQPWANQGTYYLACGQPFEQARTPSTIARILRGRTPHLSPRRGTLSTAARLSTTRVGFAARAIYDATVLTSGATVIARPVSVFVEFSGRVPEPVPFGGQVFFPGSLPRSYGGQRVLEMGFQVDPTSFVQVTPSGGGGSMSAGSYRYTHLFIHQDNEGRVWRSTIGPVSTVTAIANDQVSLSWKNPSVFHRSPNTGGGLTWVEIYRTRANGTQFFRVPFTSGVIVDGANQTATLNDTFSDANLETNIPLYADSGELFNGPPPPCIGAVVQGDRIVVIDAERPTRIAPSKEIQPGQGTGWHDDLGVDIEGDGPNTALALVEGRILVFKRQAIYVVTGDWPDSLGIGPLPVAQKIATGFGTIEPESVCQATDGVWFKDPRKGICFISRGLEISQPGKMVQSFDGNDIVAAHVVEDFEQVRFLTASGNSPVYDYYEKQWMTWFGTGGLFASASRTAAAVAGGVYYLAADDNVLRYDPTVFQDAGVNYFGDLIARLNFAGIEGVQRICRLRIMGTMTALVSVAVRLNDDYGAETDETKNLLDGARVIDPKDFGFVLPKTYVIDLRPKNQRSTSLSLQIFWPHSATPGVLGANTEGIRLTAIAAEIGLRNTPGLRKLPARYAK